MAEIHNDGPCRRCGECVGSDHHWMEHCPDPEFEADEENPQDIVDVQMLAAGVLAGFRCKHCDAWRDMDDEDFADFDPDESAMQLQAHEDLYAREDRERQLARHSVDCDCDDCEAARLFLRRLQL